MVNDLYCVAGEKLVRGQWVPFKEYLKADNAGHARFLYGLTLPPKAKVHIAGAAKPIGYYVEDKYGVVLSAD